MTIGPFTGTNGERCLDNGTQISGARPYYHANSFTEAGRQKIYQDFKAAGATQMTCSGPSVAGVLETDAQIKELARKSYKVEPGVGG